VKLNRLFALLLAVCMMLTLCACGQTGGAYTIVETLSEGSYAIAFRNNDPVGDYMEAAIKVLASNGKVAELETKWFGKTGVTDFEKDGSALNDLPQPAPRVMIMGLDPDNFPMSYESNGVYMGFDVEMCRAACEMLGWTLRFSEVGDESEAFVHLNSGNADVVWGGMILDTAEQNFSVRCPYMDGGCVLVVLAGSGNGSVRKLGGQVIAMNSAKRYMDALSTCELIQTAGQIVVTDDGNDMVFDRLYRGEFAGIVTDMATAKYYMR